MVEKIPRGVLGVPTVDDQRGGAGTERCDVIVQGLVLRGNRYSAEMQEPAAEPLCGPAEARCLTAFGIRRAVGLGVVAARSGNLRHTVERRQCGQRAVQAVVATASDPGPAVVDGLTVGIGARVGADQEFIASAEMVFDIGLELRLLDRSQLVWAECAEISGVREPGRGVGPGDVVADRTQVGFAERLVRLAGRQTQVLAEIVGEVESVLLGVQAQVGGVGIGAEFDVDEKTVPAGEFLIVVEGGVDRGLCVFDLLMQFGRGHQVRVGDIGADGRHGHPTATDLEAAGAVGGRSR